MTEIGIVVLWFSAASVLFLAFDVLSRKFKNRSPSLDEEKDK